MIQKAMAWSLLVLTTCAGPISAYWLLFAIWMTAHPLYDSEAWRMRVYQGFAITVLDGVVWVGSIVWLFRISIGNRKA